MSLLGTEIDRYRVEAQLGQGSYGAVYRARHTVLETQVALKVLWPDKADDPKNVERFLREARAAASVGSDHIVRIADAGTTPEGVVFLALELLDGEDLSEVLESRGRLPVEETLRLMSQVLDGLGAAHAQGIVHRDLKPANVFLTREGGIKILDFGISKVLGAESLTERGVALGTPRYMAPEQLSGAPVDARADLYAVGVMMYQMIAGAPPYEGSGYELIVRRVKGESPLPLASRAPVPAVVEELVHRALVNEPAGRWPTAGSLRRAIEAALRGERPGPAALTVNPSVSPLSGPVPGQAIEDPTANLRQAAPLETARMPRSVPPPASQPSLPARALTTALADKVPGPAWGWAGIAGLAVLCALAAGVFGVLAWRVGSRKEVAPVAVAPAGPSPSPGYVPTLPVSLPTAPAIVPLPPPGALPPPDPSTIEFQVHASFGPEQNLRTYLDGLRPAFADCAVDQPEEVGLVVQLSPARVFAVRHTMDETPASQCVVRAFQSGSPTPEETNGRVVVRLPARGAAAPVSPGPPAPPAMDPARVVFDVNPQQGRGRLATFVESRRAEVAGCAEGREVLVPLTLVLTTTDTAVMEHHQRSSNSAAALRCLTRVFQADPPPEVDAMGDVTVRIPALPASAPGADPAPADPAPLDQHSVSFEALAMNFGEEAVLLAHLEPLIPRLAACAGPEAAEVRLMVSAGPSMQTVSEVERNPPGPAECVAGLLRAAEPPSEQVIARIIVHLRGTRSQRL